MLSFQEADSAVWEARADTGLFNFAKYWNITAGSDINLYNSIKKGFHICLSIPRVEINFSENRKIQKKIAFPPSSEQFWRYEVEIQMFNRRQTDRQPECLISTLSSVITSRIITFLLEPYCQDADQEFSVFKYVPQLKEHLPRGPLVRNSALSFPWAFHELILMTLVRIQTLKFKMISKLICRQGWRII